MKKTLLPLLVCMLVFTCITKAQTYATPELKASEEKHILEKNKQLGIVETKQVKEEPKTNLEQAIPFDMNLLEGAYKLVSIDALDFSGKHTEQELRAYESQARAKFINVIMSIKADLSTVYYVDANNLKIYNVETLENVENVLQVKNCIPCRDNAFKIVSNTATEIVLELKPQDEGEFYVFRFTLKK